MRYFVLTNDPDHGKTEDYRRILKLLAKKGIYVTTAVFCTLKDDGSLLGRHCYKGETHTLEDREYRKLMLKARDWGHEIAFHGYSQVSDTRDEFLRGLEIFKKVFGGYPKIYIEHGGHPKKHPIGLVKKENLALEGTKKGSRYYVEDVIKEVFELVWTHEYLLDDLNHPLNINDIFVEKDGIIYFKRWRMYHVWNFYEKVTDSLNTIIGYTHFGYKGYKSRFNFLRNFLDKASFCERWLSKDLQKAIDCISSILYEKNMISSTLGNLWRIYNEIQHS